MCDRKRPLGMICAAWFRLTSPRPKVANYFPAWVMALYIPDTRVAVHFVMNTLCAFCFIACATVFVDEITHAISAKLVEEITFFWKIVKCIREKSLCRDNTPPPQNAAHIEQTAHTSYTTPVEVTTHIEETSYVEEIRLIQVNWRYKLK